MQSHINYTPMSLPAFQSIPQIWNLPFPLYPSLFLPPNYSLSLTRRISRPIFFKITGPHSEGSSHRCQSALYLLPSSRPDSPPVLRSRASPSTRSIALYVTPCNHLPLFIQPSLPPCVTASALLSSVEKLGPGFWD